jgi:hypothetical protein
LIVEPWNVPAGQTVQLKYCAALFAGDPAEAGLDTLHPEWSEDGQRTP